MPVILSTLYSYQHVVRIAYIFFADFYRPASSQSYFYNISHTSFTFLNLFLRIPYTMDSLREQWLILISTPIYFIIIGLELILSHISHRKAYTLKDTLSNLYLMLLNSGIDLAFRLVYLAILQYFFLHAVMHWQNAFAYWLVLLLA